MLKTAEEIIQYIGNAKKQTPVKVYINGHDLPKAEGFKMFGTEDSKICIGDLDAIRAYLEENKDKITETYMEQDRRNSAIPMIDMTNINARIEPVLPYRNTPAPCASFHKWSDGIRLR